MRGTRKTSCVKLVAIVAASSQCSFLFINGPPDNHADLDRFECTSTKGAPTVELIIGGLVAYGLLSNGPNVDYSVLGTGLLMSAAVIGSGVYGVRTVNGCIAARRALQVRLLEEHTLRSRSLASPQMPGALAGDPWLSEGASPGARPPATAPGSPHPPPDAGWTEAGRGDDAGSTLAPYSDEEP